MITRLTASLLVVLSWPSAVAMGASAGDRQLTARNAQARAVDAANNTVFGLRWRKAVVRQGFYREVVESFGRPAVSPQYDLFIVGQGEGEVRALRVRDGREVWRYEHGSPFETTVTLLAPMRGQPEVAVATSLDGRVIALDTATGELRWTGDVKAAARSSAELIGELLLITNARNQVFALDPLSGDVKWSTGRPPPSGLTVQGHSRATHHDGRVYVSFSDGYVEAFEITDGARVWSRPLSFVGGEFIDADADPVVADGRLFVASYSDGVYALDLADGKTVWSRTASGDHRARRGRWRLRQDAGRHQLRWLRVGPRPRRRRDALSHQASRWAGFTPAGARRLCGDVGGGPPDSSWSMDTRVVRCKRRR